MNRAGILVGFVCLAAGAMHATTVCTNGTLADYIALGADGCSVDGVTFSNFHFAAIPSFTIAPDASAIGITPDSTPILGNPLLGSAGGSGLDFAYNRILLPQPRPASGDFILPGLTMTVGYDVSSSAGLTRATMAPQLSADTLATAVATLAVGSALCTAADASQGVPGASGCGLGGVQSAPVVQSVRLATGAAFGAGAAVESVATRWADAGGGASGAPEPGTWVLVGLGLGLVGLGGRLRRS